MKNTSTSAINLKRVLPSAIKTNVSGAMPDLILKPDSFVIVCSSTAGGAMAAFGNTISVTSFPFDG